MTTTFPDYIDNGGEVWHYGTDRAGDVGYYVLATESDPQDGFAFPFAADVPDGENRITFEWIKDRYQLVPVGQQYALMIHERHADGKTWVEGPYSENDAMERRSNLWDSGEYSISMVEFRRPEVDSDHESG